MVAVRGFEVHAVEGFELLDFFQRLRREGSFSFEGVEDDALEEIAEGDVFLFGDGFEDFEHAFFEANTGLDALDFDEIVLFPWHVYQVTRVILYIKGDFWRGALCLGNADSSLTTPEPTPTSYRSLGPLVRSGAPFAQNDIAVKCGRAG
jgi:hypothetical protein